MVRRAPRWRVARVRQRGASDAAAWRSPRAMTRASSSPQNVPGGPWRKWVVAAISASGWSRCGEWPQRS